MKIVIPFNKEDENGLPICLGNCIFASQPNHKFWKSLTDFDSTNKGDTAIGSGFRLPLVMSTSINPNEFFGSKIKSKIDK